MWARYKGATHESVTLKLLISLSGTLFIALFIQSTFIIKNVLHIDAIDKNDPLPFLKKAEGRGRQLTRQLDSKFLND